MGRRTWDGGLVLAPGFGWRVCGGIGQTIASQGGLISGRRMDVPFQLLMAARLVRRRPGSAGLR